jgi:hypothetical protein
MGTLHSENTYIYERDNGKIFARVAGSKTRTLIGYCAAEDKTSISESLSWSDILAEAKNNPALQNAVDNVKMLYVMSKENGR